MEAVEPSFQKDGDNSLHRARCGVPGHNTQFRVRVGAIIADCKGLDEILRDPQIHKS